MAAITLKGVVFDLDGVITRTAKVHAQAWETAFNEFLKLRAKEKKVPFEPFDRTNDYQNYVDGKPRFEGVLSFLKSRNVRLAPGDPDDPPSLDSICGIGNRKNELYQEILRSEGPEVFQTTVALIKELKSRGVRVAVATSSRNCQLVLQLAGLEDVFEAQVDGVVSAKLELKGKPDPDIFVTAAEELGLHPGECVVVEDAISGVQAGRAGNFGMTLGVARNTAGEMLKRFGADMVVSDLGEITADDLEDWFESGMATDEWYLSYSGFEPGDEKLRETLTAVGNGYLGTRGAYECECSSYYFYPGTYISGVFNKTPSKVQGRDIWNNDLVNCPNWLPVEFKVGAGEFASPLSMEILSYSHRLCMRDGCMERNMVVKDQVGRMTRIFSRRVVSMADPHLCALKFDFTPLNYSGKVTLRSSIDGNVDNSGVARYSKLNTHHLCRVSGGKAGDGIFLHVETTHSRYQIVMAAKSVVLEDGKPVDARKAVIQDKAKVAEEMQFTASENNSYSLEKYVYVRTSLDRTPGDLKEMCLDGLKSVKTFQGVFGPHVKSWKALWQKADIRVTGDRFVQRVVRLHIYHLLVTASPHNVSRDAGMPARGLHGEAYRGHIFWDELYILPFFDSNFPDISRALLMYRYSRLDAAREYAKQNGYIGAMFPWQTADDGTEETQEVHYNPESKKWDEDLSRRQRHVSIAVFVNTWRYVSWTGDTTFLKDYGAEMMLDIARFWGGIAEYEESTGKYHIDGVMGPDEFHEGPARQRRARRAGQRLYQHHGGLASGKGAGNIGGTSGKGPGRGGRQDRPHRRGDRQVARHAHQAQRDLHQGGYHQPVRRLHGPQGAGLGGLPQAVLLHPPHGPHPQGGERFAGQLQGRQAGGHAHDLVRARARGGGPYPEPARARDRRPHQAAQGQLRFLRAADQPRLHPVQGRARGYFQVHLFQRHFMGLVHGGHAQRH